MSIRAKIRKKMRSLAKPASVGILNTKNISTTAGIPAQAGKIGELCYDSSNDDVYINSDGATTWIKIFD